jgi:aminomethyltransferase
MTEFNGWYLPIQYDGIIAEHHRTRQHCSIFDTCHMGRLELTGADSLPAISRLLTVDPARMSDGQCRYGFLLDDNAGILDDLVVYRFSAVRWWIIVNAGTRLDDLAWMGTRLAGAATLADITDGTAKVDVQGPESPVVVSKLLQRDVTGLPRFRSAVVVWNGVDVVVSRTGYTGETGYELYVAAGQAERLWNAAMAAGAAPAGLGARDTLRIEAALPLYGHELTRAVTPVEARLDRFVTNPNDFVGRRVLLARRDAAPTRLLAGFRLPDRRTARAGDAIMHEGREVGRITSASFSPTLGYGIGLAYLDAALTKAGQSVNVLTARGELRAEVQQTPFYRANGI